MNNGDYVCTMCAQDFTRKTSANRHNTNLHEGRAVIVRFVEYIVGRERKEKRTHHKKRVARFLATNRSSDVWSL